MNASPKRRIFDDERHAQFITFSCYKRRKLLNPDRAKRIVIGTLGSQLAIHGGLCIGFVIMPEHVHCLVWFDEPGHLSPFMNHWKDQTSVKIKDLYRREFPDYLQKIEETDLVWQARYYPFNIFTERKLEQKLDYMHLNPVRRELVKRAVDWPWSSARWYIEGRTVGIPIRMPAL
jgi:putative transposase